MWNKIIIEPRGEGEEVAGRQTRLCIICILTSGKNNVDGGFELENFGENYNFREIIAGCFNTKSADGRRFILYILVFGEKKEGKLC